MWPTILLCFLFQQPPAKQPPQSKPDEGKTVSSASVTPRKLEWRFKQGSQFWVETEARVKRTLKAGVDTSVDDSRIVTRSRFMVKRVEDDGTVEIEQRIESSKYECKGPDAELFASLFRRLEGATFLITLSPDMQVQTFKGWEEWGERLSMLNAAEAERFKLMVPESDLKTSLEEWFSFLPKEAVKPGDKWNRDYTMNINPIGMLTGKLQYTYQSPLDKGKVQLKYQNTGASQYKMQPSDARSDFSMESRTGTIVFNADLGRLDSAENKITTKGTLTMASGGPNNGPLTINVRNELQVKMTVKDKIGNK